MISNGRDLVIPATKYKIPVMTYAHLLKNNTDLIFAWSSTSPIGIEKIIFPKDNNAPIKEIQKTLSTIDFIYKEKNVSAPRPHHKRKRNIEKETILTENGMEKKSF